jgi:SAM-dependent methyltransferase
MLHKYFGILDQWLRYSVRRRLLDRDLDAIRDAMRGRVLEIGNGRIGRRGCFQPPVAGVQCWLYLDLSSLPQPHIQADIEQLPLGAGRFDTVVCLEVLEYVPGYQKALQEMSRVLKPGGTLIMATPFLHRADAMQDYWRFTQHSLRRLVEHTGLQVKSVRAQGGAPAVVANVLQYMVFAQPARALRWVFSLMLFPVSKILLRLDALLSRRVSQLATFSTGYLIVAEKKP